MMLVKDWDYPEEMHPCVSGETDDLYFDIETTGFGRDATVLYLIGCGYYLDGHFHIRQWLNDDGRSEPEILHAFSRFLSERPWRLLSFNGERFDLPYLHSHCSMHQVTCDFDSFDSIDYYALFRPFRHIFPLEHGRQKDWEGLLGWQREDRCDGGELINVYRRYLRTKDKNAQKLLLMHNRDDILGLAFLRPLLSFTQLLGQDYVLQDLSFLEYADGDDGQLVLSCRLPHAVPLPLVVRSDLGACSADGHTLSISVKAACDTLRHYYPDYADYYYLPGEDRAIHKSIGCYVNKEHRKKATASTCYIKKEGVFLPLPPSAHKYGIQVEPENCARDMTVYKRTPSDKISYLLFDEVFAGDARRTQNYMQCILSHILLTGE